MVISDLPTISISGGISVWNSTNHRVTFSVSASTYQGGRFFNFTLRPGAHQAYYASFDRFGNAPFFRVSFDPIHRFNAIQLSDINTVFEPYCSGGANPGEPAPFMKAVVLV